MTFNPTYQDIKAYYKDKSETMEDKEHTHNRQLKCNLCGMVFPAMQRHGPTDLERCFPRGIGSSSTGDVCIECGHRTDKTLQLIYNENEYVAICPECLQAHHGLDYFTIKWKLLRLVMRIERIKWRNNYGP